MNPAVLRIDPKIEKDQVARLKRFRANRDAKATAPLRAALEKAAREDRNVVPEIFACVKGQVTLGEVIETLTGVFGRYRP